MNDTSVPLIVLTSQQDDVELINRTLRDAGHAVRCEWVQRMDAVAQALQSRDPQLMLLFTEHFSEPLREVAKTRQQVAPMVPLVVVQKTADETAISEAMRAGAQDLVSVAQKHRLCAVAESALRAFRLGRGLTGTLTLW